MLNTIKYEIDHNRTLLICLEYWNPIQNIQTNVNSPGSEEREIEFYDISGRISNNEATDDSYLDHNVNPNTDWLIVRDNWSTTHRNVVVPFNDNGTGSNHIWNMLIATFFVQPAI
jgi:hypothetical protein